MFFFGYFCSKQHIVILKTRQVSEKNHLGKPEYK